MRHKGFGLFVVLLSLLVARVAQASDPLEPFNRAMFRFNEQLVTHVVDPVASFWGPRLPDSAKTGLSNVYSNLTEVEFVLNGLLVGDVSGALISVGRFVVNSTLGLGGWFDPAYKLGLTRRERDFGASLCATSLPNGPYLVLPFVGSSNLISAGVLTGAIALEVYVLSLVSTVLAAGDFVVDLGASAATLRHGLDMPTAATSDPYILQRNAYQAYIEKACGNDLPDPPATMASR